MHEIDIWKRLILCIFCVTISVIEYGFQAFVPEAVSAAESSSLSGMGHRPKQGMISAQSHAGNGMTFRMEGIPSI
jgi:hypothetical protein